jgi:peptidoglycan/LPS O-acetylase OafA/YrhL
MRHDKHFEWFDLLRGIAAFVVLFGHLRALMFLPYAEASPDVFGKAFFFLSGFGHEAVVVFFVLSGFFIIKSVHEAVVEKRWSLTDYALNRITRLWVVLIPALLFSFVFDAVGLHFFRNSPAYAGKIEFLEGVSPLNKMGLSTLIGNLFFLQHILVPTFGSNGALWSLANEFWYYVLFPIVYFVFVPHYSRVGRISILLLLPAILLFIGKGIAAYFLVWLLGGVTFLIKDHNLFRKSYVLIATAVAFIAVLIGIRLHLSAAIFNDFSLGLVVMLLLAALADRQISNAGLRSVSRFTSNISYSLYASHLPFAVLFSSACLQSRFTWSLMNFGFFMAAVVVVVLYAYGIYLVFERNTGLIKRYIRPLINPAIPS